MANVLTETIKHTIADNGSIATCAYETDRKYSPGESYLYELTIVFNPIPKLVWANGSLVSIDDPQRFGKWDNESDRIEYLCNFAKELK